MPQSESRAVITVESRKSIELPLSQFLRDGQIEVFPHVEKRGLLFLQFRKGQVTLTAGKYVGLIPLTPWLSVEVRPKLPVSNLARVLDGARTSIESIQGIDRLYLENSYPSSSVLEFLLSNLLDALRPLRIAGLYKEYLRASRVSSFPRGKIGLARTLQKCWSRGVRHEVSAERFEQTADIPPNRILKSALEYALRGLARSGGGGALLKRANDAYVEFPQQIQSMAASDYQVCKHSVSARSLPPARHYYYRPLEIALLIISGKSVSLEGTGSDVTLDTFIVDFETVFEDYLRHMLQALAPETIAVKDGNHEGKRPLFDDRTEPPAQPDIVLMHKSSMRNVIAEVKYKDKPDRSDINQAVTYALVYRTNVVVLLHQKATHGRSRGYIIGVIDGVAVHGYAFDLSHPDLATEEEALADYLFGLTVAASSGDGPIEEAA